MKIRFTSALFALALAAGIAPAQAENSVWTGPKDISSIQVVEHGGFLITFSTPLPTPCAQAGPNNLYIYQDKNYVTAYGLKSMYAMVLLAFNSGKPISVMYDSDSTYCFGRYVNLIK